MSDETVPRIQTASLKRKCDQLVFLWGSTDIEIPKRPNDTNSYSEEDSRHWYDMEFSGWGVVKDNIPDSPRNGASGKRLIYLQPGAGFSYLDQYAVTLEKIALANEMDIRILDAAWDKQQFQKNVAVAIDMKPDLILLNPEHHEECASWYRSINRANIPVVGGNFLANQESHKYLLAWTGPDDWGQSRLLARHLADALDKRGNYAILQHIEGNSSYYARTWGVITELKRYAPKMRLLDTATGMKQDQAISALKSWIDEYGMELNGLFCADDGLPMAAVAEYLEDVGRTDIQCVAAGSSSIGIRLVAEGKLIATAFQSPVIDAEIAMEMIIDWFEGVPVEPIRYLPKIIVTSENAAEFLDITPKIGTVNLERLFRSVREYDWQNAYHFFGDLYEKFLETRVIPLEHFQGICLEILTGIIHIIKDDGLAVEECLGTYDTMVKRILKDKDLSSVLDWLNHLTQQTIARRMEKLDRQTPVQEIVSYVDTHINEPISLKTLSHQFGISHAYLGQIFRKETGMKFNDYLNFSRVEKAKFMLLGRDVTINAVARELGYSNPDYFYKIFRKLTGQSASDFRRQER